MGFASNFTRVIFLVFPFIVNFLNTNHINANEWLFLASIGSLLTAVIDFGYSRIVFREALKKTYSRKLKYSKIIVRYFFISLILLLLTYVASRFLNINSYLYLLYFILFFDLIITYGFQYLRAIGENNKASFFKLLQATLMLIILGFNYKISFSNAFLSSYILILLCYFIVSILIYFYITSKSKNDHYSYEKIDGRYIFFADLSFWIRASSVPFFANILLPIFQAELLSKLSVVFQVGLAINITISNLISRTILIKFKKNENVLFDLYLWGFINTFATILIIIFSILYLDFPFNIVLMNGISFLLIMYCSVLSQFLVFKRSYRYIAKSQFYSMFFSVISFYFLNFWDANATNFLFVYLLSNLIVFLFFAKFNFLNSKYFG